MKAVIYAKSLAENIIDKLNENNRVHSIFKNGINIQIEDGLVFIGSDKNGKIPFGIHLSQEDIYKLSDIDKESIFVFDKRDKKLISKEIVIDLNKSYYYNTKLPKDRHLIKEEALNYLFNGLWEMNFHTGLDMNLRDIILDRNGLIEKLRLSVGSDDKEYIKGNLRKVIGRGRGLTPSGDDLLIGLTWLNDIKKIYSNEFLESLKELTLEGQLTTDVSLNYYRAAFLGEYTSNLIHLSEALVSLDKEDIKKHVLQILEYGHTSGCDTLSGIALGVDTVNNTREVIKFENSNSFRRKRLRK